jgi:hypothetical protein
LHDLSISVDGSNPQFGDGRVLHLAQSQFPKRVYPASCLFQWILQVRQLSGFFCQQVYRMKLSIYGDKLANAMAENRLLKFCLLLTLGITIVNSLVAYHAMNNQKVVILPPMVDHKIEIRGNDADDEYLKLMGRYSIKLLLDYTPSNAEQNFSDFLKLASPKVFSSMRQNHRRGDSPEDQLLVSSQYD